MKITRFLFPLTIVVTMSFVGCSSKKSDIDIKTDIETKLKAEPGMSGALVDVKNGIATIVGQCQDENCKANCEKIAQEVNGVKTVINNLTVPASADTSASAPPATASPVMEELEDPLIRSVAAIAQRYPAVNATVKDSIITLTGEIKKADLPILLKALSSLKPGKIEQKLSVVKKIKKTQNLKKKQNLKKAPKHKKRQRRR